jgi:hypothetical protein
VILQAKALCSSESWKPPLRKRATPSVRLLRKRERKAARRKRRERRTRLKQCLRHEHHLWKLVGGHGLPAVDLVAPKHIALLNWDSHRALVQFLRELVDLTLVQNRVVLIDFRPTLKFYSDGTVLFYSELQRILKRRPNSVRCLPPKEPVALQVLSHLKLLRLMGSDMAVASDRDDVTHWETFSGVQADATQGVGEAIASLPRLPMNQLGTLFRSVSEALTNVTQHAYIEPRRDGTGTDTERGWWMFVRQEPDELSVLFCDLGVGVPYTVPRLQKHAGWLAQRLASALQAVGVHTHQDGETIQATVEEKRSRFKEEHRGNGFANIVETIPAAGRGRLLIYSNRGAYTFDRRDDGTEEQRAYNYAESIHGTVVGWHIKLPKENA